MSEAANKKKQEEEDMARGCGCFIVLGIVLCILLWVLNDSVDAVKEVSLRDLLYAHTALEFNTPLHQKKQDRILRDAEFEDVDVSDIFYKIISTSKKVDKLKLIEGALISGLRTVLLTMNVTSTVSGKPKTVKIKMQFLVQDRNIWKLKFAKVLGIRMIILRDEEGQCTISDHFETVIVAVDIAQKIKNNEAVHARDYRKRVY